MYKLETHLHTLGRSPCAVADEKTIAKIYRDEGYDGIVCTNHFNRYLCDHYYAKGSEQGNVQFFLDGYRALKNECSRYDIDVFLGLELLTDELTYYKPEPPHAETMIFGIDEQWLLSNPYTLFKLSLAKLSELCRKHGWILSHAHPFRNGIDTQNPAYLQASEAYNGNPYADNHNDLAAKFAQDNNLIAMCGSDFHAKGYEGCGIYLQNPVNGNVQLTDELRKRKHKLFNRQGILDI